MRASETKIVDLFSKNKTQFVIPIYQRNYDWTIKQCKQLIDDILKVGGDNKMNAHFIGSVVFVQDGLYISSGITELTIIDGQQRLTTLTLMFIALLRVAKELDIVDLEQEISETYLINKFASEEEKLKLRPTEKNDEALKYLLRNDKTENYQYFSRLIDNFNYLDERINKDNYRDVLNGISKLIFVEISLDREKDSPQRIFESLNSTGLKLSQADLIRNFILMRLSRKNQNKIYKNYWEKIEKFAKNETSNISKVSDFIRDYLTLENKNIPKKDEVYIVFKDKYPSTASIEELEEYLSEIKTLVQYYNKLINPTKEKDKDIRLHLNYISRLEINVAYPFLMKVYSDYANSVIDKDTFINILLLIQSFVWRRFIMGLPTNSLNKIFMSLYDKVDKTDYLVSIQRSLAQRAGVQRFPRDKEILDELRIKDVYNIKSKNRIYFLESLENFENKEKVEIDGNSDITIEHIFPQNPSPKWKIDLGEKEYSLIKDKYLNTIGNLTLSGNNNKLGNKPFIKKRDLKDAGYKDSRLWLNKHLSKCDKWDKEEIEKRQKKISKRFLKIWKFPDVDFQEQSSITINIFESDDPTGKKLEYAIFFDQIIDVKNVTQLYIELFKQLFELQAETFFITDLGESVSLTKNPKENGLREPEAINSTYFIEKNHSNMLKFDKIKYALEKFSFEDELSIKYAE